MHNPFEAPKPKKSEPKKDERHEAMPTEKPLTEQSLEELIATWRAYDRAIEEKNEQARSIADEATRTVEQLRLRRVAIFDQLSGAAREEMTLQGADSRAALHEPLVETAVQEETPGDTIDRDSDVLQRIDDTVRQLHSTIDAIAQALVAEKEALDDALQVSAPLRKERTLVIGLIETRLRNEEPGENKRRARLAELFRTTHNTATAHAEQHDTHDIARAYLEIGALYAILPEHDPSVLIDTHKRAVEQSPNDVDALIKLYFLLPKTEENDEYAALFNRACAIDRPKALNLVACALGTSFHNSGQHDKALEHYTDALTYNANDATAMTEIARIFAESNDNEAAAHYARQAIHLDPENAALHLMLGAALFGIDAQYAREDRREERAALQTRQEMVAAHRRAYAIDPTNLETTMGFSAALSITDNVEGALHIIQAGLELNPNNTMLLHEQGVLFSMQQNWNAAITAFQKAQQYNPLLKPIIRNPLANALANAGRTEDALTLLRDAVQEQPDAHNHQALGTMYLANHRPEEAITEFKHALSLDEGSWSARLSIGDALIALEQHEAAMNACRDAIAHGASFIGSVKLAEALHMTGKTEEARTLFENIVTQHPRQSTHYAFGRFLLSIDDPKAAEHQFKEALKRYPHAVDAARGLSEAYTKLGKERASKRVKQKYNLDST